MKILRYLVIVVASLFIFSGNVNAAASNFEPTINMQPDITENQLQILLGYKGEEVMAINHSISWDSTYLTLLDVVPLENFTVTKGNEVEDGVYRTISILGDSDYSFTDTNYALLIFEVTDKFKVGKKSDVIYYDYQAVGPNKNKLRHKGLVMTLQRDTNSEMLFLMGDIDNNLKIKYWFKQNYLIVAFILLVIVALIVVILNIPSKRKNEHREKDIVKQTKEPTYIPKQEVSPYKIDNQVLDSIGGVKKEVDMSEAIVISDINPFGQTGQNNVSTNSAPEVQNQVVMDNNQVNNTSDLAQIKAIPQSDDYNNFVDAFSQKIDTNASTEINDNPVVTDNNQVESLVEMPKTSDDNLSSSDIGEGILHEVNDNPENLVLFQPTSFEEKKEDVIDTLSFILVFFIASFLFAPFVKASDVDPNMIRECIVGNIPYDKAYDLNDDYKVDVIDIILTKDLTNVTLEKDDNQNPGFADIDGVSDTIISTGQEKTTTTKKTTTKKSWWPVTTTKKSTTSKKTTTKKTTTKKTTTKKTTTKKTTTTITKKTTTTTATPIYNVSVKYENATVDVNSQQIAKGKKAYFTFTPNTGYKYKSVTCDNASSSWSSSYQKLTVSYIKGDTVCTVNFAKRTDMKVKINVTNGQSTSLTIKGEYLGSGSISAKPKTGYQYSSLKCNKVKATYSDNKVTVASITDDDTCELVFTKIPYDLTIKYGSSTRIINDIPYGDTIGATFSSTESGYTKVKCVYNGTSKTVSLTKEESGSIYNYSFDFKVTSDTVCTAS